MESYIFPKTSEIRRAKTLLEDKLKVKINITGRKVSISGDSLDEYEAGRILEAMQFGFSADKALILKDPEMIFERINIKDYTRKKDLSPVKARIIGKHGQTIRVLEQISGSQIILNETENDVGVIGNAISINETTTAIENLIKGTKQSNVYRFLEKTNKSKRKSQTGLGIKE